MSVQKLSASFNRNSNIIFRVESKLFNILSKRINIKRTPIIIISFNRLEFIKEQVDWLLYNGYNNIHIIDNASTYLPLLKWYKSVKASVYILDKNLGHEVFWRTHLFQRLGGNYHVITDSDLLPTEKTPKDFLDMFYYLLNKYQFIKRVGFGLEINDIPDHYPLKKEVIDWEMAIYKTELEQGVYMANIDTTFALSRPNVLYQCWGETIRTSYPYLLRHMPWYEDPNEISIDGMNYINTANSSSSWYNKLKK